jgi:hypothetical protein
MTATAAAGRNLWAPAALMQMLLLLLMWLLVKLLLLLLMPARGQAERADKGADTSLGYGLVLHLLGERVVVTRHVLHPAE